MVYKSIDANNKTAVNEFIVEHWYTKVMVVNGEAIDMTLLDGIVCYAKETCTQIMGLITFRFHAEQCEIISINSVREKLGIGTQLIKEVVEKSKSLHCHRVITTTTNDNILALYFYQKLGFDIYHISFHSLAKARELKPQIPLVSVSGIRLSHEIELEFLF